FKVLLPAIIIVSFSQRKKKLCLTASATPFRVKWGKAITGYDFCGSVLKGRVINLETNHSGF
ncbi:MAG: hypothetical protein M9898_04055, partial [Chitinophagaceae bacterium]|nr:hypothetical protein [Chitinophagaceae bacterium]